MTHLGTKVAEVIDELAERGRPIVSRAEVDVEVEVREIPEPEPTPRASAATAKKTAQSTAAQSGKKAGN
jgi:hypothetical protein